MNMKTICTNLKKPFGHVSCEEEQEVLQDEYSNYFFWETPFNDQALERDVYLIVGRRGSGKTSLTRFFGFQDTYPNAACIDVGYRGRGYRGRTQLLNLIHDVQYVIRVTWQKITNRCLPASPELAMAGRLREPCIISLSVDRYRPPVCACLCVSARRQVHRTCRSANQ
jgi:hypothetical protein